MPRISAGIFWLPDGEFGGRAGAIHLLEAAAVYVAVVLRRAIVGALGIAAVLLLAVVAALCVAAVLLLAIVAALCITAVLLLAIVAALRVTAVLLLAVVAALRVTAVLLLAVVAALCIAAVLWLAVSAVLRRGAAGRFPFKTAFNALGMLAERFGSLFRFGGRGCTVFRGAAETIA